ncbi:MAG: CueP family metal-binding protein [Erysipelotrichales bacterium]
MKNSKTIVISIIGVILIAVGAFYLISRTDNLSAYEDMNAAQVARHFENNQGDDIQATAHYNGIQLDNGKRTEHYDSKLFYTSIAPYYTQTHECYTHFMNSCQGELANEKFDVKVVDNSGKEIFNKKVTSAKNGFAGIWLPKDIEGKITVKHNGKSVTSDISTNRDSATCRTDMKLR